MAADRVAWMALLCVACAGGSTTNALRPPSCDIEERFPLHPCPTGTRPEAVGVWQDEEAYFALVYDGCELRMVEHFTHDPPMFAGLRNIARATVVDLHDFGDPPPYFRSAATWRGAELCSRSLLERCVARWVHGKLLGLVTGRPLVRARRAEDLGRSARMLLCVDRVVPTEEELARQLGLPMRSSPPGPPDDVRDVLCPRSLIH